ncbi:NADP-dependent oxidoreductase domain-containing protein [Mycena rosella]|uniref:NADP-dependent oxidoreductase domain-containing protein n=1 Tax=Mycena rosella TaxID=1033263 RepID=A0AAD7D8Q2_MYCRO|nr:NADP-dependent oxidoreductase domain-containing protein [Mycena rosella]
MYWVPLVKSSRLNYHALHVPHSRNGPTVSAMGLGAMGKFQESRQPTICFISTPICLGGLFYGSADEGCVLEILTGAANSGITFWDTADAYGHMVQDDRPAVGNFLVHQVWREDFTENAENIYQPDSQPSHVKQRIVSSLSLLDPNAEGAEQASRTKSYIDLYFQHRVDPDTPVEVVLETLRPFIEAGKIRYVGLR